MNAKKAKKLRSIVKSSAAEGETRYKVIKANTLKPQFIVDTNCNRGFYRSMKKAIAKAGN